MLRRRFPSASLLLVALAIALAACGRSERAEEARIVGDALTVYSSLPQTGPLAEVSRDMVRAEKLALEQAGGRAGDYRISYVSLDSADPKTGRWTPDRVVQNARAAVEDLQTIAYIGELEAGASAVSVPILNEGGMLQVSPGDTFAGLTEAGLPGEPEKYYPSGRRTFARMVPDDDEQVEQLVALMRRRGVRRAWLADDRQVGGTSLVDRLERRLRTTGIEVVDRERLDPKGEVPEDLARDVREDRTDAFVYAGAYQPFAVEVLRAVHAGAPRVDLFAPDGMAVAPDLPLRAGGAGDKLLVTAVQPDEDADFARRFRSRYGSDPHPRAVLAYDAMRLVLEAIDRAGAKAGNRPTVIREALSAAGAPRARFAAFRIVGGRLVRAARGL
ncbi:MAG TPA: branched-chain amino acid ABC transporter substrate-binding protein [Solirubrobacteraceae bacterium]|nr:branched-chain amino acid ABC transporter substrate-binding protein [Solirubrobacteraceae bacterium]